MGAAKSCRVSIALLLLLLSAPPAVWAADSIKLPTSLSGPMESTSGDVKLTWGASPTSDVTHYEVGQSKNGTETTTSNPGKVLTTTVRAVEDGKWQFVVRACVHATCSGWTPPVTVKVTLSFPDYLGKSCPVISQPVPAQENVGATAGEAGVSGGQASYHSPLVVPPGRRGVQPSPALDYASRGGEGSAGVGWSLAASSRIQRCAQTPAQDGQVRGIDFSDQDRLCLDGQHLVLVGGTYGRDGSEYRTELDRFARITLQGDINADRAFFVVQEKDGQTLFYGAFRGMSALERPADAPMERTLAWWLQRRQDQQRNSTLYEYATIAGQHVLTAVRYTGVGFNPGDRAVEVEYEPRPDISTSYIAGALIRTTQRIKAVTSKLGANIVQRYELSYVQSRATGRSLLNSIQECTTSPCTEATSLPTTTFEYSDEPPAYLMEDVPGGGGENVRITTISDLEGDGTRDVLREEFATAWSGPRVKAEIRYLPSGRVEDLTGSSWKMATMGFDRESLLGVFPGGLWSGNRDFDQDGRSDGLGIRNGHFAIKSGQRIKGSNLPLSGRSYLYVSDFDGNGKSDLLVGDPETGAKTLYLQLAPLPNGDLVFQLPGIPFPSIPGHTEVYLLSDFDGNGLPDVFLDWTGAVPQTTPSTTPKIVFTHKSGSSLSFDVRELGSLGAPPESFAEKKGRGFLDINGDGLPDMYQLPNEFWFNRGGRFVPAPVAGSISLDFRLWDTVMPMDWNADGKAELLVPSQVRVPWCYLNLIGPHRTEPLEYCSTPGHAMPFSADGAPYQNDRTIYQWDAIELAEDGQGGLTIQRRPTPIEAAVRASREDDHFGDGLPDVLFHVKRLYGVTAAGPGAPLGNYHAHIPYGAKISHNHGPAPDLLKRVTNGLGGMASWEYQPLSNGPQFYRANFGTVTADGKHYLFTSSMLAVSRFEQSNGIGGTNTHTFRYEDAMANNEGRGFLGFRKIIDEEALPDGKNLRATTTFRQQFPYVSAVEEVSIARAGDPEDPRRRQPIEHTRNRWNKYCRDDADPATPAQYCFTFIEESVKKTHDLESRAWLSTTITTNTYNPGEDRDFGNVSSTEVQVKDATARLHRREIFAYDYADAHSPLWWISKLLEKTVTVEAAEYTQPPLMVPRTNPENARQVSTVRYEYYPGAGSLARLPSAEIVQPGSKEEEKRTAFTEYDAFGNPKTITVTAALVPKPRTTRRTYSPDGYFLDTETNALGHTTRFTFDRETGQEESRTDANGVATSRSFDAFGRVLDTTASGLAVKKQRIQSCDASCPANARLRRVTVQDGTPVTTEYVDLLGRVIKATHTAFDGDQQIVGVKEYDPRGHVVRESQPSTAPNGAYFTRYEDFDELGRPARKVVDKAGYTTKTGAPDETFVVKYSYDGLTTRIMLDGRLTASRTSIASSQLGETIDTAGQRTKYRYDGAGRLVLIEDSKGNQTRAAFNAQGHKLWAQDPDRGRWTFMSNGLGELIQQTDANGTRIDLKYDELGRVRERLVNGRRDAIWSYDAQAKGLLDSEASFDAAGHVVFERDLAYDDPARRPTKKTARFDNQTFTVLHAYDCDGAPAGTQYPNGEAVAYRYTPNGYLEREFNPLARPGEPSDYRRVLAMTPRGQVALEAYGNGLFGRFEYYDSTGQVRRICVGDEPCRAPVQELEYAYTDPYGNLTSRSKELYRIRGPLPAVLSVNEDLVYDSLQRLTSGTRNWPLPSRNPLAITYDYDALGNLTRKSDYATQLRYGDSARANSAHAGPHAVREIQKIGQGAVTDFLYDENGNLIHGDGRQIAYSAFNKPIRISEGANTTNFAYDQEQARYKQETNDRVTRYAEGVYEQVLERNSIDDKVYVGTQVMVIRTGPSHKRNVLWLHPDHLGSTETITNESGQAVESHGYSPFGVPWTGSWDDSDGQLGSKFTTHGFTGHEHLDDHRLIHMNGRAYDPRLGRFLSVDPFISNPANGQALNSYSYIINNPLAGVDPSGYIPVLCGYPTGTHINCGGLTNFLTVTPYLIDRPKANGAETGEKTPNSKEPVDQLKCSLCENKPAPGKYTLGIDTTLKTRQRRIFWRDPRDVRSIDGPGEVHSISLLPTAYVMGDLAFTGIIKLPKLPPVIEIEAESFGLGGRTEDGRWFIASAEAAGGNVFPFVPIVELYAKETVLHLDDQSVKTERLKMYEITFSLSGKKWGLSPELGMGMFRNVDRPGELGTFLFGGASGAVKIGPSEFSLAGHMGAGVEFNTTSIFQVPTSIWEAYRDYWTRRATAYWPRL